jgi:hypothetical protein
LFEGGRLSVLLRLDSGHGLNNRVHLSAEFSSALFNAGGTSFEGHGSVPKLRDSLVVLAL